MAAYVVHYYIILEYRVIVLTPIFSYNEGQILENEDIRAWFATRQS